MAKCRPWPAPPRRRLHGLAQRRTADAQSMGQLGGQTRAAPGKNPPAGQVLETKDDLVGGAELIDLWAEFVGLVSRIHLQIHPSKELQSRPPAPEKPGMNSLKILVQLMTGIGVGVFSGHHT